MPEGRVSRRVEFTDRSLKAIKPPPRPKQLDYFDDTLPGFGLRVSYNGRKSWIVLYRCNGVKGRLTLGRFDVLPLVDARELARDALKSAARGHDPGLKKDRDREAPTFKQLADRYVEEYAKPRKRTWQKDQRLLEKNLIPGLGRHKAHMITRADLRAELNKVKNRPAPVEANRTFEVVRRLFNWAIEEEILTENPAAKLAKPAEEIPRERTLTADELQILWRALDDAIPIVRSVFRLMMLGRAAAERGFADALARSRPVRGMVEHPGRVDQDEAALPGADHARDAGDHRGNGKARARSRMGFPSAAGGGPVPETNVTRPFRRLIKDAGIAHFMPHDLLHTRRPSLGPMQTERWPDDLSDWALPPAGARSAGNSEPVRVFDTAEAALACLLRLLTPAIGSGGRRKVG